jgi:ABC-type multidrug transport system fused ATPase/permease subunit
VHAVLVSSPAGLEIRDNNSSNGTFVNGAPITRAMLRDGDIVTIGNTDLVAAGHTLVPRAAPTRTSGLTADMLALTIDGHPLLEDVSFTAKPGTLTAVIGPSGAGKSTLVKLISGSTPPSAGVVTFDGHDVHAEYASMRSRIGMVPQDDVVHRQLTVEQALNYAAARHLGGRPSASG